MARNPGADNDGVRPTHRDREKIRALRIRPHAHTIDRTCLVGDTITVGMYIGPLFVGINSDDTAPEWKYLTAFQGVLRTGTCTIEWLLNGALIATQNVTTLAADAYMDITPPIELHQKDQIQITISAASGAADLAAAPVIVSQPS